MRPNAIILLAAAALVAGAPHLLARRPAGLQRGDALRIAVNMTTVESIPVFLAADGRAAAQIDVISGGIPLLIEGKADAATNSETQALIRSVGAPKLRIILTVAECYYRLVARRSAGISRVADLRGKKIGAPPGTSSQYYLARMLQTARLTEADVTVVPVQVPDMAAAMKRGDVDAVSSWEPGAQNTLESLGTDAVVFQDRSVYRELFNLNTTTDVLGDPVKRRAVVDLVRTIVRTSEQVRTRPATSWPLLASKINVSEPTISTVWRHFRFAASLPGDLLDVLTEEETWVASLQKRAPRSRQNLQSLVDATVLRDARVSSAR